MIQSNELREGNLLLSVLTKEYVRVGWLQIKHVSDGNIQSAYDNTPVYEPIPLSAEILEKAGFVRGVLGFEHPSDPSGVFIRNGLRVIEKDGLKVDKFQDGYFVETYYSGIEIKSLHQLQNLYFALTGEELPVEF